MSLLSELPVLAELDSLGQQHKKFGLFWLVEVLLEDDCGEVEVGEVGRVLLDKLPEQHPGLTAVFLPLRPNQQHHVLNEGSPVVAVVTQVLLKVGQHFCHWP